MSHCPCEGLKPHFTQFQRLRHLGLDPTKGCFAEVVVLRCVDCGQLWLKYLVEDETRTAAGRWARGRISEPDLFGLRAETARALLETLPEYIVGGSLFGGETTLRSGSLFWAD